MMTIIRTQEECICMILNIQAYCVCATNSVLSPLTSWISQMSILFHPILSSSCSSSELRTRAKSTTWATSLLLTAAGTCRSIKHHMRHKCTLHVRTSMRTCAGAHMHSNITACVRISMCHVVCTNLYQKVLEVIALQAGYIAGLLERQVICSSLNCNPKE